MKARVKATGDIIEISEDCSFVNAAYFEKIYNIDELEFLNVKGKSFPKDDPDYWTRLEHQAAIAAMQGFLASGIDNTYEKIAEFSINQAHALVEKYKKEEKK